MNDIERLAIAQAVYKIVSKAVSTHDPDSLRSSVDARMLSDYAETGAKSREVRLNGEKVGTLSVKTSKESTATMVEVSDYDSLREWASENAESAIRFAMDSPVEFAKWNLSRTGELPDGVSICEITVPGKATGTTLRVDVERVAKTMGSELPSAVAGLLGGGE